MTPEFIEILKTERRSLLKKIEAIDVVLELDWDDYVPVRAVVTKLPVVKGYKFRELVVSEIPTDGSSISRGELSEKLKLVTDFPMSKLQAVLNSLVEKGYLSRVYERGLSKNLSRYILNTNN